MVLYSPELAGNVYVFFREEAFLVLMANSKKGVPNRMQKMSQGLLENMCVCVLFELLQFFQDSTVSTTESLKTIGNLKAKKANIFQQSMGRWGVRRNIPGIRWKSLMFSFF